jgi:hypothetical protein
LLGVAPFSSLGFLPPRVLQNPIFHVSRIFHNLAFRVSRILCNPSFCFSRIFHNSAFCVNRILHNPAFHVSNPTRTSYFLLRVANPADLVNPANPICSSTRAFVLANPANPMCLPIRAIVMANLANPTWVVLHHLANPDNPAGVTQILSPVRDLCNSTCQPRVHGY